MASSMCSAFLMAGWYQAVVLLHTTTPGTGGLAAHGDGGRSVKPLWPIAWLPQTLGTVVCRLIMHAREKRLQCRVPRSRRLLATVRARRSSPARFRDKNRWAVRVSPVPD
jgi:hypothetical protein